MGAHRADLPMVSVIVPTYNRPEWLGETLRSILAQSYHEFEIIVVNDAGPSVSDLVDSLNQNCRIKVITHDRNKGLAAARNTGTRAARGKYIAYLDDDDIFLPHHLETLVAHLESTGAPVAYSDAYRATQRKEGETYVISQRDVPYSHDWDNQRILVHNFVPVLCFVHERRCLEAAGWFDESLTTHEDWDLWIRMSRIFTFSHVKEVTCEFRWREDGSSMSSRNRLDFLRTADAIYKKYPAEQLHQIAFRRQQHLLEVSNSIEAGIAKPTPDCLLVSIIIPVFNRLDMTKPCLEAIHRETAPGTFEIIVVDNASSDGTREYLEAERSGGRIRTIRNDSNLGFSRACNQGIQAARGGFILLLNNDTVPLPGWLDAMLHEFLTHPGVGAVGSCLLYPGGELIQHAGVQIGAGGGKIHPYHPWRLQRLDRVPEARQGRDCQVVTGACLLMRRSVLDQVGLLDEAFINGFEDVDLCFRITQSGHRVRYCPKSRVIHHESMTPGRGLHEQANYERLNDRWKAVIKTDESPKVTSLNVLEIQCRERLLTEPDNSRAITILAKIAKARHELDEAKHWEDQLQKLPRTDGVLPPSVSIIIPVLNNLPLTRQCLNSIERAGGLTAMEVIVVDNGSNDGTAEFLQPYEQKGGLRVVRNQENRGFAHACNQGASTARGRFVLFLNNDTVVTPGWIDAMVVAAHRSGVGVVGAKLLYPNGTIQHAGIGWINGVPDHPLRNSPGNTPEANFFRELDMVTGACFLMPRELFLELGGFDETFQNGVEDVDLCLRARAAGHKVVYEPKAAVYHVEGQSAGRFDHVNQNLQLFFRRWGCHFDQEKNFKVPRPTRIVPAAKSCLFNPNSRAETNSKIGIDRLSICWEGSFLDSGSLSHVNRQLTHQIEQFHEEIELVRVSKGSGQRTAFTDIVANLSATSPERVDLTIRLAWPPNWQRPASGKLAVIQPWEFGALPEDWVKSSGNVDEFWVSSSYVEKVYLDSGIPPAKIKIVPLGINPDAFHPEVPPRKLATSRSFKFLFVGGTIGRKGPDLLLKAYLESFTASDDVCLVIKDFGGGSVYKGLTFEEEIKAAQERPNAPEILYLNEELPPDELPGLYTACGCLVHPFRGEGFGLPVLEAMACGLPAIVTAGGATDDFATDQFAFRVSATRRNIGREIGGMKLISDGWLLEPNVADIARQMKWVLENRQAAAAKGREASRHVRREWTWKRAAEILCERLRELHAKRIPTPGNPPAVIPPATVLSACVRLGNLDEARELLRRNRPSEAWAATLEAIHARPFHPEAHLLLAEIALSAGDAKTARQCAERTRGLAPGWQAAKKFLQKPLKGKAQPAWLNATSIPKAELRVTVCVIARNEERFLDQCLRSVRGLASQIVLVDTGSTDRTIEIAKQHGAEVHSASWNDDFSAVRNVALEHATGDWILMLDADEELPPAQHANLLRDIRNPKAIAYRLPLVNHGKSDGRTVVPRLFRNAPGAHFYGRIHEQVFPSLLRSGKTWGLDIRIGTAQITHYGYSNEITADRNKVERNLRLLKLAVAERPADVNLLMNLGLEYVRSGEHAEGMARYREAFRILSAQPAADVTPELRETLLTQFVTHLMTRREYEEITRILGSSVAKNGGMTASLHYIAGLAHFEQKQHRQAAEHMRKCIDRRKETSFAPINTEILTAAPAHCLALSLAQTGDAATAEKAFEAALREEGRHEQIRFDFAMFLNQAGRAVEALQRLYEIVTANAHNAAAWELGGRIGSSAPEFLEFGLDWTSEAIKHLPESPDILAQRAEVLLLAGDAGRTVSLVTESAVRSPKLLAALVAAQLLAGEAPAAVLDTAEHAVSREFLQMYRRFVAANAGELVARINERLGALELVLPTVAQALHAVLAEADSMCAA